MRLIPTAQSSIASSISANDPQTVLLKAVGDAISAAAGSGLRTCTVSIANKAVSDIQVLLNQLKNILGYGATIASTTLTITW